MPLQRIQSDEAVQRVRRIRNARWPDGRKPQQRLGTGVAKVSTQPSFTFKRGDKILTIGSCFARNIEMHIANLGFDVPMLKVKIPRHERVSDNETDLVNKYTVHSMENEIRWAFEGIDIPEEKLFLQVEDGGWHDPHLAYNLPPAAFERVSERRQQVMATMRELASSDIVIITLGLAESWFDLENQLYLNGAPPPISLQREPNRFCLDVLSYNDIIQSLYRIHDLIKKYGRPGIKILVTVSPVPFKASFSGQDAMVANCYSKSVQRAACEELIHNRKDVDYFPSYEIVTLSDRQVAYTTDNIHVQSTVVAAIMDGVIDAYCSPGRMAPGHAAGAGAKATAARDKTGAGVADLLDEAKRLRAEKEYEASAHAYATLLGQFEDQLSAPVVALAYAEWGVCLLRARQTQKGVEVLNRARALQPANARVVYKLGLGYGRLKENRQAISCFREAIRLDPSVADYHWRLAEELIRVSEPAEVRLLLQKAVSLDPTHRARKRLAEFDEATTATSP